MISRDFSKVNSVESALRRVALYVIEMCKTLKVNLDVKVIIDGKLYDFESLNYFIKHIRSEKGYNLMKDNGYQINSLIADYITECLFDEKEKQDKEYEYKIELKQRRKLYDRSYADKNNCLYFLTNKRKKDLIESSITYEEKTVNKTETVHTEKFTINNNYSNFIDL